MDLSTIIDRVARGREETWGGAYDDLRATLGTFADATLNPLRDWLADFDMALTDAEEAAYAHAQSDPCGRAPSLAKLRDALDVLHCELVQLVTAAQRATTAATRTPCLVVADEDSQ
jgi:acyl-CoA reductase-like NAD-dependent aldehyde dehydrogenase